MVANKSTLKRSRPADVDTTTSKRGRNASVNIQPTVSTSKTGAASGSSTSNNDTGLVSPGVNRSSTGRGGKRGKTSPGSRYDSSLGLLTKKFIALIKKSFNGSIDLNEAAVQLQVQKRRIYDITNVLEGVALIEKKTKNIISWRGDDMRKGSAAQLQIRSMKEKVLSQMDEERELDQAIELMSRSLKQLQDSSSSSSSTCTTTPPTTTPTTNLSFISHEDLRTLTCYQDRSVVAIKAPSGTTLEVPDPDEGMPKGKRRFQIFLNSTDGPVDVYLVSQIDPAPAEAAESHVAPDDVSTDAAKSLLRLAPITVDPTLSFPLENDEGISDYFGPEEDYPHLLVEES